MSSEMNYLNIESDSYEVADAVARAATATNAAAISAEATAREAGDTALATQIDEIAETVKSSVAPAIYGTASGDIASFDDGADSMPLKELTLNITPVQSGEGDPSPTNIRPISGWTGANVYVSPTTDTADATTYPITWTEAGTVYGGTLDVVRGKLTRTWYGVDMGTLSWQASSSANSFYARFTSSYAEGSAVQAISSTYPFGGTVPSGGAYYAEKTFKLFRRIQTSPSEIYVKDSSYTSVADFKTAVTGQTLAYELATPIEYDLDPVTINTLLGQNNVWADCGGVENLKLDAVSGKLKFKLIQ